MTNERAIRELTIKGFRSIRSVDRFPFQDLNVLIGSNGAGKSNFISYFRMLTEMLEGRLQQWTVTQGTADRIVSFGLKETTKIESSVLFGRNGYKFGLESTVEGRFVFSHEELFFDGDYKAITIPLGSGHDEATLKRRTERGSHKEVARFCYNAISSWKVFHFHDTSDTAGVKRVGSVHDNEYLRPDASNLAAYLFKLSWMNPDVYHEIRNVIQLALPFFDDFLFKPQALPTEEEQIRLLWLQKGSDYPFWPSQLSDGSIRFICLVTALLQPNPPSTILIDEPELGLHPYAITLLASLLRAASKRMQVIVSTQSVSLLNEFSVDDVVVVERENQATVFKRYSEKDFEEWLKEFSLGELWEKNLLGGRPTK